MFIWLNLGILVTVFLGTFLWPQAYEATSTIVIRGRDYEDPLFHQSNRSGPWTLLMNPKDEINSEMEIIRSRPVLERTIEVFKLYEPREITERGFWGTARAGLRYAFRTSIQLAREVGLLRVPTPEEAFEQAVVTLNKNIKTEPAVESQIIRVSYRDRDPKMARDVVNEVVNEYLRQHLAINLNRSENTFYQEQMRQVENEVGELRQQMVELKTSSGILDFDKQVKTLIDKMNTFDVARTTVQKEIISQRSKVAKIQQVREANPDLLIPLPEIEADIQIQDLENKLINLRYETKTVLDRYTDTSRQAVTIRDQVKELEDQIRLHVSELLERDLVELDKLEAERLALDETIEGLAVEIRALPAKEEALNALKNQLEDKESILTVLRKKYQESLVAGATDFRLENAKVVSRASIPIRPATPNVPLNLGLGLLLSLVFSVSLVSLLEYLDDSLRMPEDVETKLGLRVIASIPELGDHGSPR